MHSLARKLMVSRQLDFDESGKGNVLGSRVFMINRDFLVELENHVETEVVKRLGRVSGSDMAKILSKRGLSGSKALTFAMEMLTMFGLGKFSVASFDLKSKKAKINVENCATEGAEVDCVLIEGILSGVFSQVFGKSMEFNEVACMNRDAKMCQFASQ